MIIVIGDGGHSRDIISDFGDKYKVTVYPHHTMWKQKRSEYSEPVIIAINDPQVRARVARELGVNDSSVIHSHAYLGVDSETGNGTHINYGVMMTRTKIGDHCTIAPGVHMAGDITIGDRVFIGIGATIGNLVTIGDDAIIGAGSVVLKDVPAGTKVLGVWA